MKTADWRDFQPDYGMNTSIQMDGTQPRMMAGMNMPSRKALFVSKDTEEGHLRGEFRFQPTTSGQLSALRIHADGYAGAFGWISFRYPPD